MIELSPQSLNKIQSAKVVTFQENIDILVFEFYEGEDRQGYRFYPLNNYDMDQFITFRNYMNNAINIEHYVYCKNNMKDHTKQMWLDANGIHWHWYTNEIYNFL
jgi:hypothetical protein